MGRSASGLNNPRTISEAIEALRDLIQCTSGFKRDQLHATLRGEEPAAAVVSCG